MVKNSKSSIGPVSLGLQWAQSAFFQNFLCGVSVLEIEAEKVS